MMTEHGLSAQQAADVATLCQRLTRKMVADVVAIARTRELTETEETAAGDAAGRRLRSVLFQMELSPAQRRQAAVLVHAAITDELRRAWSAFLVQEAAQP